VDPSSTPEIIADDKILAQVALARQRLGRPLIFFTRDRRIVDTARLLGERTIYPFKKKRLRAVDVEFTILGKTPAHFDFKVVNFWPSFSSPILSP
jgi:hypothetical protein